MLWIGLTVAATVFQVARNAAQRNLIGGAGPWGATLVRFLFGLPFALLFVAVAWLLSRPLALHPSPAYFGFAVTGAGCQVLATAALLVSMHRAGFAIGTALQQSSLPLSALLGWLVFHDRLGPAAWTGVAIATVGLAALSWPRRAEGEHLLSGSLYGLLSGLLFGFSLNAFRHAALTLEPARPLFSAVATVAFSQAIQTVALGGWLAVRRPEVLRVVFAGWRGSLFAGFCGATASAMWLSALALAPAASVRAVGVVESPIAALAGRRLYAERLSAWKLVAGALTAIGVALTALG
jgi:drug/metabolite transporter (DMT)-like permease